jgi:hypothetical protein
LSPADLPRSIFPLFWSIFTRGSKSIFIEGVGSERMCSLTLIFLKIHKNLLLVQF